MEVLSDYHLPLMFAKVFCEIFITWTPLAWQQNELC